MQRSLILTAALAAALPLAGESSLTTPAVVITASRTAESIDETLASVTVIDAAAIRQSAARTLDELLANRAGIEMVTQGGIGGNTSLFMRGSNSQHLLVLIDGVKINSAAVGGAALHLIPLAAIERIEIVRGPRSALYGGEAIGGIVQIFTRQAASGTDITAAGGSHGEQRLALQVSERGEGFAVTAGVSQLQSGGIDAQAPKRSGRTPGDYDRDGHQQLNLNLNLRFDLSATTQLQLSGLNNQHRSEYDGCYLGWSPANHCRLDSQQTITSLQLRHQLSNNWQSSLAAGEGRETLEGLSDGTAAWQATQQRRSLTWQHEFTLNHGDLLTAGLDYQQERVGPSGNFLDTSRINRALYGQYQRWGEHYDLQLSARHDKSSAYGSHTTHALAIGHTLNNGLRLILSRGTAYKSPTFYDLIYTNPNDWSRGFNSGLRAERSQSHELSISHHHSADGWRISLFQTAIDDLITLDSNWNAINLNQAEIRGVEFEVSQSLGRWLISADLNHSNPQDRQSGKQLARRARQSGRIAISQRLGEWRPGLIISAQGERYDDAANTKRLPGYAIGHATLSWHPAPHWSVVAKVENLTHKHYSVAEGYATSGRHWLLSLNYRQ
jgi:vitamin B12 transporter